MDSKTIIINKGQDIDSTLIKVSNAIIDATGQTEKSICITISEADDSIRAKQHRFYRGAILPEIARESFDGLNEKAHMVLKSMFLLTNCQGWADIPKKHRDKCLPIFPDGDYHAEPIAYIPSMATLTIKEAKSYIDNVIQLCSDMGLQITLDSDIATDYYSSSRKEADK